MYKVEAQVAAKQCKAAKKTFAELASGQEWDAKAAMKAPDEELPRALLKARGFLAGC